MSRRRDSRRESIVSINSIRRFSTASLSSFKRLVLGSTKVANKDIDSFLVNDVRQDVIGLVVDKFSRQVDPRDIQTLRTDNDLVERFIEERMQADKKADRDETLAATIDHLVRWLKWRHAFEVNDLLKEQFFLELYESGLLEICMATEVDKSHLVYVYLRNWKKGESQLAQLLTEFLVVITERLTTRKKACNDVRIVMDTSGIGYTNVDLTLISGLVHIWMNYFPGKIKSIDVVDANFVVRASLSILIKLIPVHQRNKVHFIERKSLIEEVGANAVPECLHGSGENVQNLSVFLKGECPTIEEYGQDNGMSKDLIRKLKKMLLDN